MPTNSPGYRNKKRNDGKTNYEHFLGTKEKVKERSERNKARRKKGLKIGDPREVDHVKGVKAGNGKKNLRVISQKKNRQLGAAKANRKKTKGPNLFYV